MLHFYGVDYFTEEITRRQKRQQRYYLQHVTLPVSDHFDLFSQSYRQPWKAFAVEPVDSPDEAELEKFGIIFPHYKPHYPVSIEDVIRGLVCENFNSSVEIEQPILGNICNCKGDVHNAESYLDDINCFNTFVSNTISEPSLKLGKELRSQKKDDPFEESYKFQLEKPLISELKFPEPSKDRMEEITEFEKAEESAINLDKRILETLSRKPVLKERYYLRQPTVPPLTCPGISPIDGVRELLMHAHTDTAVLKSISWNPFKIEEVAGNINRCMRMQRALCPITVRHPDEAFKLEETFLSAESMFANNFGNSDFSKSNETQSKEVVCFDNSDMVSKFKPSVKLEIANSVDSFMKLRNKKVENDAAKAKTVPVSLTESKVKYQHRNIECELDEIPKLFVMRLLEYAQPFAKKLVAQNILPSLNQFLKMEPSNLKFLYQESIKNNDNELLKTLQVLTPVCECINLAVNLNTEVSLDHLKAIASSDAKFCTLLPDLYQMQSKIVVSGLVTSKMMQLSKIIKEQEGVKLVIITSGRHIKSEMIDTLSKLCSVAIAPAATFSNYSCYLLNSEDIDSSTFGWESFNVVVEYNKSYLDLQNVLSDKVVYYITISTVLPMNEFLPKSSLSGFKIIAYSHLDFKVLQQLETHADFEIYQRNSHRPYTNETIIVDERTSIVILQNLDSLAVIKQLSVLFIELTLKYKILHIIIDLSTCHKYEIFPYLFSSTAYISPNTLKIYHYYCLTVADICNRIISICEEARSNVHPSWSSTELWLKRTWLTEEESSHEKLLVSFPSINSYVSQIMLTTHTLPEILSLKLEELIDHLKVIPTSVLTHFHNSVHPRYDIVEPSSISKITQPMEIQEVSDEQKAEVLSSSVISAKSVQFDLNPTIQDFVTPQKPSEYLRTSLPFRTKFDLGLAINQTYATPANSSTIKVVKTPVKPKSIVKPMFCRNPVTSDKVLKRQVEQNNKYGFSFSKKRKVLVDKRDVNEEGQTRLYIGEY